MHTKVQSLIKQTIPAGECCTVAEYLKDALPVCMEAESDSWETDFLVQLGQEERQEEKQEEQQVADEEPNEDDD